MEHKPQEPEYSSNIALKSLDLPTPTVYSEHREQSGAGREEDGTMNAVAEAMIRERAAALVEQFKAGEREVQPLLKQPGTVFSGAQLTLVVVAPVEPSRSNNYEGQDGLSIRLNVRRDNGQPLCEAFAEAIKWDAYAALVRRVGQPTIDAQIVALAPLTADAGNRLMAQFRAVRAALAEINLN